MARRYLLILSQIFCAHQSHFARFATCLGGICSEDIVEARLLRNSKFCPQQEMLNPESYSTPGVQMGSRCGHVHCGAYEYWYIFVMFAKISAVIAYQTTLTFWTAAFPGLARNTPQLRAKAEEYNAGRISRDEYDYADTMQRSRLSNMAFYIQSCGEIVILAVIVGVLYGVNVRASEANNNWGLSVLYVHFWTFLRFLCRPLNSNSCFQSK